MSERTSWGQMINRCYDPMHPKYHRYGARGIRVCDRWICFRLFHEDMGDRPDGMTLNRIDNDGPYSKENCEWANPMKQAQNRSDNHSILHNGVTKCLSQWARDVGLTREALRNRLQRGWSVEDALTIPAGMPR